MKDKILQAIKQFDIIIVHRHVRPDPDAYGSQCGLSEIIRASFPEKKVYSVGNEEKSLNFLSRLDDITDKTYNDALVIVCDTANEERIDDTRYSLGKKLIKIDHHPNETPYGDIIWVDTSASSTSEMIYEFYKYGKNEGLVLNKQAAELIYAGIVGDTGRFMFPNTNPITFKYASELIEYGFSLNNLYNKLYETKLNVAKLNGYVFQNLTVSENGAASVIITKEMLDEFEVTPMEASQLVSTIGHIKGIKAWVFFVEEEDVIRVRLRSKTPVINGIAKKYNGGGHPLAAGASIYSWDTINDVLADLEKVCAE
ncbi:bifunctional oligoribonuclease/PAP phosphatase NrnA [Cytobacillus sp. IB215665]|uniref:DHH family phosphoesterase n=1 Tax=Cytobacillus sp. IB215665 TaxID=3097357 RepID=UPI002A17B33E|nr:bifunctional oligoribonuclease/PAP phosphatase NrnA [Cytobacillus sp. IB215665]MDX8363941.1 bifunctional oligoribonuclease/PAP phosphatase NrnA [Cytobacillus sp. IB215665]